MEEEDLQGWEVVPDDGFLEIHDEDDGKKIFSRKFGIGPSNVFKNYFICPSPKSSSPKFVDSTTDTDFSTLLPKQLVTVVPIHLDPPTDDDDLEFLKKLANPHPIPLNIPTEEKIVEAPPTTGGGGDQDPVSQVSFKKKKEPEFVEMKLDSPRSNNNNNSSNWGIKSSQGTIQFDDGEEKSISKDTMEVEKDVSWEENSGGPSIWKWSLTGIGAICSFGVAAATVCIVILGGHLKNNNSHHNRHNQDNKLQFHIYADDKRLKQVVHHASKLNEAISAVRGVPISRARITVGGYYDGL